MRSAPAQVKTYSIQKKVIPIQAQRPNSTLLDQIKVQTEIEN